MNPQEILRQTQRLIAEYAGSDTDKWWYANRFVYARLQLDERKTKTQIRKGLVGTGATCHRCGEKFESNLGLHLHRLDDAKGYTAANCVLMHPECHKLHHSSASTGVRRRGAKSVICKKSKRWDEKLYGHWYTHWWDITPSSLGSLETFDSLQFFKKDTEECCTVATKALKQFLVPERRTSRSGGNWGIRVLADRPNELAFEPPVAGAAWLYLPVVWGRAAAED